MPYVKKIAFAAALLIILFSLYFFFFRTNVYEALNIFNPLTKDKSSLTAVREAHLVPVPIDGHELFVPEGFGIKLFASNLGKARLMALGDAGEVYISSMEAGEVIVLFDENKDGIAESRKVYMKNLKKPHGLVYHEESLYVAEENKVSRTVDYDKDFMVDAAQTLFTLPEGGNHKTRTIAIDNGRMYVSIGSTCNACIDAMQRAEVLAYDFSTQELKTFATGLRNSVGIVVENGKLYGTDNGRDFLGEDLPAEEVNSIEEGKQYGWPYCYDDNALDPEFGSRERCENAVKPLVKIQAHSAPLGLRFIKEVQGYENNLFIALHGSWDRKEPTGYKIVRVFKEGEVFFVEDVVTGWLEWKKAWGRPVDILEYNKGILISDDYGGRIFYLFRL